MTKVWQNRLSGDGRFILLPNIWQNSPVTIDKRLARQLLVGVDLDYCQTKWHELPNSMAADTNSECRLLFVPLYCENPDLP